MTHRLNHFLVHSVLMCLAFVLVRWPAHSQNQSADFIFTNGKIWTGENANSFAEAVAIRGDKILAIGEPKKIQLLADEHTQKIDLKGRLVTAGFNDAHIHFLSGSLLLSEVNLFDAKTVDDIKSIVIAYAKENPSRQWITGRGWLYEVFGNQLPNKKILDEVIQDRPVFLKAYDGHTAWVNSKALQLAGVNKHSIFSGFGEIVKDVNGEPTGALKEDAMQLIEKLIPQPSKEEKLEALKRGLRLAASLGITSFQNAKGSALDVELYQELMNSGSLTARVSSAFTIDENTTEDDIIGFTKIKDHFKKQQFLTASVAKITLDGVIESHTAAMLSPYTDLPSSSGELSMPLKKYQDLILRLDRAGFQIYTHAIGDRAVRVTLDAYESASKMNHTINSRHRIEHIETVDATDLPRFKKLGVLAAMQPIHADPGTTKIWEKAVGPKRLSYAFAWRSILQAEAPLIFGSDWPACISINPIRGLHVAVNRRTPEGQPANGWVVNQKNSIAEAMKAYTQGGAFASFEENNKGKIASGYLADLIVLSEDLFTVDPMKTHEAKVLMTMVGGKIVFQDEKFIR
jgi:predicted amidohydrolase YtcJ